MMMMPLLPYSYVEGAGHLSRALYEAPNDVPGSACSFVTCCCPLPSSVCLACRQGADTCAIGGVLKESALMWAARQGYMTIIVDLLQVSGLRNALAFEPWGTGALRRHLCGKHRSSCAVFVVEP